MTFTYEFTGKDYLGQPIEKNYDYEPEYEELKEALARVIVESQTRYDEPKESSQFALKVVRNVLNDIDDLDTLTNEYEDALKAFFEDKAKESFYETV